MGQGLGQASPDSLTKDFVSGGWRAAAASASASLSHSHTTSAVSGHTCAAACPSCGALVSVQEAESAEVTPNIDDILSGSSTPAASPCRALPKQAFSFPASTLGTPVLSSQSTQGLQAQALAAGVQAEPVFYTPFEAFTPAPAAATWRLSDVSCQTTPLLEKEVPAPLRVQGPGMR